MKEIVHTQKTLFILLAIALVLAGLLLLITNRSKFSYKASANPVVFSVSSAGGTNYSVGSIVTVSVNMNTAGNSVGSAEVIMSYPKTILTYRSDTIGGSQWNSSLYLDNSNTSTGIIDKTVASAVDTGVSGSSTVFTVQFNVIAAGPGSFTITEGDAGDVSDIPLALTTSVSGLAFTAYNQPATPAATLSHTTTYRTLFGATNPLTGTKSSGIATVLVNGSSANVTYPDSTHWSASGINLNIGSNTITLVGTDGLNGTGNQSSVGTAIVTRYKLADANNDGVVNYLDFSKLGTSWNKSVALGTNYLADFNEDGAVGILDFSILATNWKK
jgi:hypothetical protein